MRRNCYSLSIASLQRSTFQQLYRAAHLRFGICIVMHILCDLSTFFCLPSLSLSISVTAHTLLLLLLLLCACKYALGRDAPVLDSCISLMFYLFHILTLGGGRVQQRAAAGSTCYLSIQSTGALTRAGCDKRRKNGRNFECHDYIYCLALPPIRYYIICCQKYSIFIQRIYFKVKKYSIKNNS